MSPLANTVREQSPAGTSAGADAVSRAFAALLRRRFRTETESRASTRLLIMHGGMVVPGTLTSPDLSPIGPTRADEVILIGWGDPVGLTAEQAVEPMQFAVLVPEGHASTYGVPDLIRVPTWRILSRSSAPSPVRKLPAWVPAVDEKLRGLTRLPPGWDSYSARPISADTAAAAMELLRRVMQDDTPVPSMVPMYRGGIQLERHLRGMNI